MTERGLAWSIRPRPTDERHRVTTFELLFDLVYVFAITQVTGFMAHGHDGQSVVRGLLLLAILWWTWSAYAWLGNQVRADIGAPRIAMALAMAAIFVVALTIPEAWEDAPGGLDGPVVLVCAYIVVRVVHLWVYMVAAAGDPGLRRQLLVTWVPMLTGAALLLAGSIVGGQAQTALFAAGLFADWLGTYITSRRGRGWRLNSPAHWTERHGLIVMLAVGESIVAIGVGAAQLPISTAILVGASLGVALSTCLWWLYFDIVAEAAEQSLLERDADKRVLLAVEAYTYIHYLIVAGIIVTALGIEVALAHAEDEKGLGTFGALALNSGLALYLLGHVAFKLRMHNALSVARLVCAGALLALVPVTATVPPLAGLAIAVACIGALVGFETWRYAETRQQLRHAP